MRCSRICLLAREFFPIKRRIEDRRLAPLIREQVEVTSRQRPVTETFMDTGATRQTQAAEWSRRVPPTHFLSLRIPTRSQFQSNYAQLLHEIAFSNEKYSQLFVKPQRLHVTASVFSISADKQLDDVVAAAKDVAGSLSRLQLLFEGLGTFSNGRVLFVKVVADQHHYRLSESVERARRLCAAKGIDTKGNPRDSYVPHVTLAKVRPSQVALFPTRVIPPHVWAPFKHDSFGSVAFDALEVCSMSGEGAEGYYNVVASIPLRT